MYKLSIDKYLETKTIVTEDGVKIKVRQLGAGEALDISQFARKLSKLYEESQRIKSKVGDNLDINSQEYKDILDLSEKIDELNTKIESIYLQAFDDGTKDKATAKQIIHTLGAQKMPELMKDIFADA